MENIKENVIKLKQNCEMLLDILDNKKQYERESKKMLEISKLTRENAKLNFEINKDLFYKLWGNTEEFLRYEKDI